MYSAGTTTFYGTADFLGNGQYDADANGYEPSNEDGGAVYNSGSMTVETNTAQQQRLRKEFVFAAAPNPRSPHGDCGRCSGLTSMLRGRDGGAAWFYQKHSLQLVQPAPKHQSGRQTAALVHSAPLVLGGIESPKSPFHSQAALGCLDEQRLVLGG